MEAITFEIKSLLKFQLDLVEYPELSSPVGWVQRGIDILKIHAPGILRYLSQQRILARLRHYKITLRVFKDTGDERIIQIFKIWVQKEKMKRLVLVIIEALIIPFTAVLALLPGPNIFFYVPALLFYYHLKSFLGLRKIDVDDLDIKIRR